MWCRSRSLILTALSSPCSASAPASVARRVRPDHGWSGSSRSASPAALHIVDDPAVLAARSIRYYARRTISSGSRNVAVVTIGAVFLAVTGAEALYVDLGHFGRKPIVMAWVWPWCFRACCSTISARAPLCSPTADAVDNPFFEMLPRLGAAADGAARHRGHRDRQPGGDLRRLFADAPGRAARTCCRASKSSTLRRCSRARSTCRASICCSGARRDAARGRLRRLERIWPRPTASPVTGEMLVTHDPALRRHDGIAGNGSSALRSALIARCSPSSMPASSLPTPPRSPRAAGSRSASRFMMCVIV